MVDLPAICCYWWILLHIWSVRKLPDGLYVFTLQCQYTFLCINILDVRTRAYLTLQTASLQCSLAVVHGKFRLRIVLCWCTIVLCPPESHRNVGIKCNGIRQLRRLPEAPVFTALKSTFVHYIQSLHYVNVRCFGTLQMPSSVTHINEDIRRVLKYLTAI